MKLQHLAIIFVIIILPISLIVGEYVHSQINTINLQTSYTSKLQTATYDAMQSLKLNTVNNKYSTVSDSKLRDVEASVSTFYKSLGREIKLDTYTREELTEYIPAMLYTMYDGYYIYSKYYNETTGKYEYGLKPFVYYSCRYKKGNIDIIINYTLDNYITIYGYIGENYITKAGNVINPNKVTNFEYNSSKELVSLKYGGVKIEREELSEQIIYLTPTNEPIRETYKYIIYNTNKVYYENTNTFFTIGSDNQKHYVMDQTTVNALNKHVVGNKFYSDSALKYYDEAYKFSEWLQLYLPGITQKDAVDGQGQKISVEDFAINTGDESIFDCSNFNQYGDAAMTGSTFDLNRLAVIRKSIKDNLLTAIANYNNLSGNTSYEYVLPVLNEEDWYRITNNISMVTFMQGIPIGTKYFNNYAIITNNENKEVVKLSTLLAITEDGEVHLPNCKDILDGKKKVVKVYKNIDFERQDVVINRDSEVYYYPHSNSRCYSCLVNAAETYDIDYIEGKVKEYNYTTEKYVEKSVDATTNNILRKQVLSALARESYDLYKINDYFKGYDETIGLDSIPGKEDDDDFNGNIKLIECRWNKYTNLAIAKFKKDDSVPDTLVIQYQINPSERDIQDDEKWSTYGTYNNGKCISIEQTDGRGYPNGTKIYLRLYDGTYDGDYLVYQIKDKKPPKLPTINIITNETINGYYTAREMKIQISAGSEIVDIDEETGFKELWYKTYGAYTLNDPSMEEGQYIRTTSNLVNLEFLNDGITVICARTVDNAGNKSEEVVLIINKDSTPPTPPTIEITEGTLVQVDGTGSVKQDINPTISMSDYSYGSTPSTPIITGNLGHGTEKIYYAQYNSSDEYEWKNITSTTLDVGKYEIWAEIGETENYKAGITNYGIFNVTPYSVPIPNLSNNTLTYNGSNQSPTINNFNSTYINQTGTTSAKDVGTYTITWTLKNSNYKWSDGTTTQKSATWTINKFTVTIPTLSNTIKTYNGSVQSPTITNPHSAYINQTGTASATNAGTYTIIWNLISTTNLKWSDGTTTQKSATWEIKNVITFTSQEFAYTGGIQEFTVPIDGIYTLEVWGAQGQNAGDATGGKGGYSKGNVYLTTGTKLYIGVGGQSNSYAVGGYNGGGKGDDAYGGTSGAGGGATHIAKDNNRGTLDGYNIYRSEVLIVAGRRRWSFIFRTRRK